MDRNSFYVDQDSRYKNEIQIPRVKLSILQKWNEIIFDFCITFKRCWKESFFSCLKDKDFVARCFQL
jgi:hypothetical protein